MGKPVAKPQNIAQLLADLRGAKPSADAKHQAFPLSLAVQRHVANRAVDRRSRNKVHIFAENADDWVNALPADDGDTLRAYLPGDFVFGEVLPKIVSRFGAPKRIDLSTLSLSLDNVEAFASLLKQGITLHLALSHYFEHTNKAIFSALTARLSDFPAWRLSIGRIHAKTCLFEFADGVPLVIETSANLRSSNTIEAALATRCRDVFTFHRGFLDEFHRISALEQYADFTGYKPPAVP